MEFLQVRDGKIVTESGTPVFLRGTCIGGWMNLEDFINGYPGTESGIRERMAETLGASKAELFFERMMDRFFNEEDVQFLAQSGANCIRIPLNYRHFEDDGNPFVYKEEGFRRLERAVSFCEKAGLYVILDLHAAPGWQNCHWHSDNERGACLLFTHQMFQDRTAALWAEIARRFAGNPAIAGYDLLNEPSCANPNGEHAFDFYENLQLRTERLNRLYRRLEQSIRAVDPRHILFLEGDNYARSFRGLEEPFAANLAYSSHSYTAPGFGPGPYPGHYRTEEGAFYWDVHRHEREFRSHEGTIFADKHQVPLWVGEFGSQYHGPKEERPFRLRSMDDQLSVYNRFGAHWTTWTYKDLGVMGWATLDPESEYMQIIRPVQEMKRTLGAENFVMRYDGESEGRGLARALSDKILDVSGFPGSHASNAYAFNYAALTGYAAAMLQPAYARRFAGMSEDGIERVTEAFRLKNCIVNEGYLALLKKRLSEGRPEKE